MWSCILQDDLIPNVGPSQSYVQSSGQVRQDDLLRLIHTVGLELLFLLAELWSWNSWLSLAHFRSLWLCVWLLSSWSVAVIVLGLVDWGVQDLILTHVLDVVVNLLYLFWSFLHKIDKVRIIKTQVQVLGKSLACDGECSSRFTHLVI